MNKFLTVLCLGLFLERCDGREPFKPRVGSLPFLVYYSSRYRGLCIGTLLSSTTVITAAVCVTNPTSAVQDTRPINVVTAAAYRHPRRGIRVQVTKILLPKMTNVSSVRGYLMQKSPAILLLKRKVPDVLAEIPLRAIEVDYKGQETLSLLEECFMPGWHFFYRGGMYGAPLICRGKVVAMLMAPDAQWSNCTGFSNMVHLFTGKHIRGFMDCVSELFAPEFFLNWGTVKSYIYDYGTHDTYDYLPALYDKIMGGSSSSEEF